MGHDFIAKQDGLMTIIINNYDHPCNTERQSFSVIKGQKYSVEYTGVDIEER